MLTIKAEIKKDGLRKDNTYNIKLRFTLNRQTRRLSTSFFARPSDLTRKKEIKQGTPLFNDIYKLLSYYEERCRKMEIEKNNYSIDTVISKLEK